MNQITEYHSSEPMLLEVGPLVMSRSQRTVCIDRKPIRVTSGEFDLLWFLAERTGCIVTRDELYSEVLHFPYDGINRSLDLRVSRLRRKLERRHCRPVLIKAIRSEGYLLVSGLG